MNSTKCLKYNFLQCFDAVGSAAGRASGLQKTEWWDVGVVIWVEVQTCIWPSRCHCHSVSLAPVNPDWFYLPGFYLSGTCSPGWSRTNSRRAVKRLCVCVCLKYKVGECFFWYPLTRLVPDKIHRAVKRLCVCVCACVCLKYKAFIDKFIM